MNELKILKNDGLLTPEQAAQYLQVKISTIYKLEYETCPASV